MHNSLDVVAENMDLVSEILLQLPVKLSGHILHEEYHDVVVPMYATQPLTTLLLIAMKVWILRAPA
ncbi:uncharacterized protein DS421_16g553600 [Arachis hypogaea]|nr:uncharacterized protein DS421_16g553600 [Arachis hypogaea]